MLRIILEKASLPRELRADIDLNATVNLLVGAFYWKLLAAAMSRLTMCSCMGHQDWGRPPFVTSSPLRWASA